MDRSLEKPIRVLLIDDHQLFRDGLRALLEENGFDVVADVSSGEDGLRLAVEVDPDVVIMDLRLPGMSGVEAIARLSDLALAGHVLALTVSAEDSDVLDAMVAGASGYLLKDALEDQLVSAVRATAAGDATLTPSATARLVERLRSAPPLEHARIDLSPRELEVLRLLAAGAANAEIADALMISPMTARNHVAHVLEKLGVENRVQAAVYAVRTGLV